MNITNWHTSRIRFPICPKKRRKNTIFENFQIYLNVNYVLQQMSIWPTPCSFKRTERTPCRLQLVLQGILKSPHCSTLLIHSTCLERQRTQAVDSLASDVTPVVVRGGFFQKQGEGDLEVMRQLKYIQINLKFTMLIFIRDLGT